MRKLLLLGALLSGWIGIHAQGLVPKAIPCTEPKIYTPGYLPGSVPNLNFSGYNCVDVFGPIPAGIDNVIEKGHVDIVAGKYVHIGPGVHIGPMVDSVPPYTSPQYTHVYIGHNDFDVVWFEPNSTPGTVGQYEKLELGVKLPSPIDSMVYNYVHHGLTTEWLNPFDPLAVRVEAVFNHLNGYSENDISYSRTIDGFYYREYLQPSDTDTDWTEDTTSFPFRIRYAPTITGNWAVNIKIYTPLDTFEILPIHFNCVSSSNLGYVQVGLPNKNFLQLGGNTFYPVGQNLAWPYDPAVWEDGLYSRGITYPYIFNDYKDLLKTYRSAGANTFRMVNAPYTYEIEFEELGNYSKRMKNAWELDRVIELADSLGLKLELNLQLHVAFEVGSTFDLTNWDWKVATCSGGSDAAYAYATDLGLTGVQDFFESTNARNYFKNRLRYYMSRYNYSTSIIAYEIVSEVNNMGKVRPYHTTPYCGPDQDDYSIPYHEDPDFATAAANWLTEMAGFIKNDMGCTEHLISTCYTGNPFASPPSTSVVHDGGTLESVMYRGDSTIMKPIFDLGSYNAYSTSISSLTGSVTSALDYSFGFGSNTNNINKPLIHSEYGVEDSILVCGKEVEFIKQIYTSPFTGLAAALQWTNEKRTDLFHHYGSVANFMNMMLDLHNISNEYWKPSYGTINGGGEPQVEYYCLENAITAIDHSFGIVVNRTYNGFSEYNDNSELHNDSCTHYINTLGTDKYPEDLRHKISVADIDGDHTLNLVHYDPGAYLVEWYNPFYGNLIKTDPCTVSIFNENLELDFPDLNLLEDANNDGVWDTTFLPFVYFYAYPIGDRSMSYIPDSVGQNNSTPWNGHLTNCQLYPNPANHFTPVNVNCGRSIQKIELYSSNGHLLHNFKDVKSVLTLPELARGMYYLKITLYDKSEENHKLVVLD